MDARVLGMAGLVRTWLKRQLEMHERGTQARRQAGRQARAGGRR